MQKLFVGGGRNFPGCAFSRWLRFTQFIIIIIYADLIHSY